MKHITSPRDYIKVLCTPIAYVPSWSTPKEIDPKAKPLFVYQLLKYMAPQPCFAFNFTQEGNELLISPKNKPANCLRVVLAH